jgi:quercetin dioxygenase-like cupin family protein
MKKVIKAFSCYLVLFSVGFINDTFAQADPHTAMHAPVAKTITNRVMDKALTDTGLINKKLLALEYTFAPGYIDTISHRHGAEVFIYVVEGTLEHRLGKNEPIIFKKGQMLHEAPYALHTLTKNTSNTEPLKLLITFVYTNGPNAPKFIREYPVKK